MNDILPFLKSMMSVSGLSGFEAPIADLIAKQWTPLTDEVTRSRLGSVHGFKRGNSAAKPRPSVLISTHMDAIGLMVSRVENGFLHVTNIGGVDPRVLPGTPVTIHATKVKEDLYGVMVMPPANLLPEGKGSGVIGLPYLLVETGLTPPEVEKRVHVGDRISFATEPIQLGEGLISGHSIDNRASVAALTVCLEALKSKSHGWDVWAVATVQEEVSMAGAMTSPFEIRPTIAVAVDVTFGTGPGASGYETFPLGKGLTIGLGPTIHPFLAKRMNEVAKQMEIPVKDEPMPEHSATDGDYLQLVAEGIPTVVLSIPERYMHTPVEVVALKDIQRAGRLLAEFVASLEDDFMNKISWD